MVPVDQQPQQSAAGVSDNSVGWIAHKALRKHFRHATRYKKAVLKDTDPEPLHQMRVGLRQLRTTLTTYGFVVCLPEYADEPSVKKLAKTLGRVRDIDVLTQKIEQEYRPRLPKAEQAALDIILKRQKKARKRRFVNLSKTLKGKPYRQFESAYRQWLASPDYTPLATSPIQLMSADVLLPLLSQVLLHPGWFYSQNFSRTEVTATRLDHWLKEDGLALHDLRKQVKQLRYQVEFLSSQHADAWDHLAKQFKQIQEVLGQFQDLWFFNHVLDQTLSHRWATQLPTLSQHIKSEQMSLWASWQPIVEQILSPNHRNELRRVLALAS